LKKYLPQKCTEGAKEFMQPILITLAICLPLVAGLAALYIWVDRKPDPDLARYKVLRVLLCLGALCLAASLITSYLAFKKGESSFNTTLTALLSTILVAIVIAFQFAKARRKCKRRL
jgi:peptidoglycan biosynthesis protein MviN/MurJ (putative lipid II flippase)